MKINSLRTTFKNKALIDLALTHRSWVNENPGVRESNERLEFLGDAVLELVVTDHLYKKFPKKPEGYLTALRANIVNTTNLSKLAKESKLYESIFLSKGERESGTQNNSLLADTVEAIIGAIYLDLGLAKATDFIRKNILMDLEKKVSEPLKDSKSELQELVQSHKLPAPSYKVVKIEGPDHARIYFVEVYIKNKMTGKGNGKNKSEAEQRAATAALANTQKLW